MKRLENVLNGGRKLLAGAGLVYLLSVPVVIGCEAENSDDDNSGGNGGQTSGAVYSDYNCECKRSGDIGIVEVSNATSKYNAERSATSECNSS